MNRLFFLFLALLVCTACVGRAAAPNETPGPEPQDMTAIQFLDADPSDEPGEDPWEAEDPEETEELAQPVETEEPEGPYIRTVDPSKPMVALTFDDGPSAAWSDVILDTLEANHALATFFEVGNNVRACPEPVQRMAEMGCEIASHSNAHRNLSKLKKSTLLRDLDAADAAFVAAGVEAPTLVRPPYGAVNKTVKSATGRAMITWTVDTEDWRSRDAQAIVDYVQNCGSLDGEIILMHSIYESTADAVTILVPWLQEQGYQLVTVTELMAYYYGELPQPDTFYGYTYFTTHDRTDTPVPLPGELIPGQGIPPEEEAPGEEESEEWEPRKWEPAEDAA